ncbi:hypothetical protein BDR26DRAFT_896893 [Obelidium mucronatum]|nr:hypothetical protein BDR26DRAFT_896893 [Obelidium mucronatum]
MLTLKSWNVKRVAIINEGPMDNGSWCKAISRVLEQNGFLILAKLSIKSMTSLSSISSTLLQADARYMVFCAGPATTASVYFGLAKKQQLVGKDFVWFCMNKPDTTLAYNIYGPDFYKIAKGFMNVYGLNAFTPSMLEQEMRLLKTINEIQAAQDHHALKLIERDPSLLSMKTYGDNVRTDPLSLSETGGLSSLFPIRTFYIQCVDGMDKYLTSLQEIVPAP